MQTILQRGFVKRVALSVFVGLWAANASAHEVPNDTNYRIGTIVASDENECAGVPGCLSVTSPGVLVPAAGRKAERFACPTSHPNLWAWDAAQHEHILVQLVAVDQFTATIEGVNSAKTAGVFIVALGCSTEPYAGSGFQKSRQLAPTARLPARRPYSRIMRPGAGPVPGNPCEESEVPSCQPQQQPSFSMGGWATTTKVYQCKAPYPFAWAITYAQTGSPSVSALSVVRGVTPGAIDVLLTNWNPFQSDTVDITVACSKSNISGGACGGIQSDPGCPVVGGSEHNYCSSGPVPVCFQTYQERCAPNNQLFQCTIDLLVPWCQPCPG